MVRVLLVALVTILLSEVATHSAITIQPWVPVFKGIEYASGEADTNEVRLQKAFAFRIDLLDPAVEMFSTPAGGPFETIGQTTTTFVNSYGVKVGVNANFFSPVSTTPNDPRYLSGIAISQGQMVSPTEAIRRMLLVTSNNIASIVEGDAAINTSNYWTAVAGSDRVLINGVVTTFTPSDFTTGNHPRTAVGISQDGRYLIMLTIDGRQPAWSDGAPLADVAAWLIRFGSYQGLNLDGGGSTAMVKAQSGSAVLVNKPSGGIQRVNGNHLGTFSQDIAPIFVNAPQDTTTLVGDTVTLSPLAGGTTPLYFQWQFSGANISGATKSTLTITNAAPAHTGTYTLVVSNHVGVLSGSATLDVNYALVTNAGLGGVITKSPSTPNHAPNSIVTLTAVPDPGFAFTGWSGDISGTANPISLTMNGHKSVTATFSGFPTEVIVDNVQASFSNTWSSATTAPDKYGTNYRTAALSTTTVRTATFRPNIFTPGSYAVYIWYPTETARATNAPWTVFYNGGSQLTRVNQNLNGGRWNLISSGRDFLRGTSGYVTLRNTNSATVIADAVKFVYGVPPQIAQQPQNVTVVAGSTASFQVTATGTASLSYQWFRNGTPLPSATNSNLSISQTGPGHAGTYSAIVTNLFGAITSSNAELIVNVPPTISSQPIDQSVLQGEDVTLSVSAGGTVPFSYLWYFNGTALPSETGSSLSLTNVQTNNAGIYFVRVTNVAGAIFSSNATLTVSPIPVRPTIVSVSPAQIVIAGRNLLLQAKARGTLPFTYQWRFNGGDIPGALSSSLLLTNIQPSQAGNYSVQVGNEVGSTNSANINVTVHFSLTTIAELGGIISISPQQESYAPGSNVSLSATPDVNFSFLGWSGAVSDTNLSLTVNIQSNTTVKALFLGAVNDVVVDNPNATYTGAWTIGTSAAGRYGADYHFASTSSSNVTETATYTPNINTPGKYNVYVLYPSGGNRASNAPWETVSEGSSVLTLVNQMTGGGAWQLISGAHSFARGTNGFVRLVNTANNSVVIADAVRWAFIYPPRIVSSPTNRVVPVGSNVVFNVSATGSGPITYQWFFNESPILGANDSAYQLGIAQPSHSGAYSVAVSNISGMDVSAPALLTVVPSPVPLSFETVTVSSNGLRFVLNSEMQLSFAIETSTNLLHWSVVTNFVDRMGPVEFDAVLAPSGGRFYRARITN